MRVTLKHREPVGIDADTEEYVFNVRTSGETRKMLVKVNKALTERLGGTPSNPLLLREILAHFIATNAV